MEQQDCTDYELGRVIELNSELAAHCYGIAMHKLDKEDVLYKQAANHYTGVYAATSLDQAQSQQTQLLALKKELETK